MESSELIAILRGVRERVRASNPETARGGIDIALPDLAGLLRARDAAMGKVAAIGTVNPRAGGVVNKLIQAWKRLLARVLDWHVREQVEFNRTAIACVDAAIDALNQSNLALVDLGNRLAAERAEREAERAEREAEQGRRDELDEVRREAERAEREAEQARREAEQARREELDRAQREADETRREEAAQARHDAEYARRVAEEARREGIEQARRAAEQIERAADEARRSTERSQREAEEARRAELERQLNQQMSDVLKHWEEWRVGWEKKLATNEMQFLRSVADLEGAFQYRLTLMDGSYRDTVRSQHADFTARLDQRGVEIQKRLWADMEKVRAEFDKLIHVELRLIRQRLGARFESLPAEAGVAAAPSQAAAGLAFDYARFAEAFRGSEDRVQEAQQIYLDDFRNCTSVLDIGCGRGEFLELMREAGVQARGIDSSLESIALCREKNLPAEIADLFEYLGGLNDGELDGIFCSQVVEHLPPERLPEMIRLASSKLRRGGVIAIETPNPECLAIFSTYFYLDPTHYRPVPQKLLTFYLSECGIGDLQVRYLEQAMDSMPSLAELPQAFRQAFFGGLDYSIVGRKV